ncbi:M23 family metallopeptidase [Actinoplanes derwentensis]|uniref:Murein DD-endopeptidase MepM and murein hydrolase activator NlpD, contain LysM domain n=1 Tax=Actinoplanes derwentensis TaxID=113562 RepID=A0A1H2CHK3_9ACTN|nr:M23 family metallopeptidase [Actinoplanes derwentensis]SDT69799.1 Murein DD-endopeptidase MepM and murein hydrolase activator NlpD, contain LysM domain [Actinoplanes derwentensis]
MGYRRLISACLCLLGLAALVLTGPRPAAADRSDEAAKAVRRAEALLESASATARTAAKNLARATAGMPAARDRVARSRGVVVATRVEAGTARREAATARAHFRRVSADYRTAAGHVEVARDRVDEIVSESYMGGNFDRINMLVDATGPQDLLDRLGLVEHLMTTEQEEVQVLVGARRVARTAQDRAGTARRDAEAAERAALAKVRAAERARAAAIQAQQSLDRIVTARRVALRSAERERSTVIAQLQAARRAEQRIRGAMRGWEQRAGVGSHYPGGSLLMPVHGWKSSNFGYRYDPYYRVWQLHAGTDFAAGGGSPIRAAASGRVIQAGWNGGYGRYTCINHGRLSGYGFTTCYAHQSRMYVHVGEYVRRGEMIGRVGSTGASTGAHLHFETRFGGVPRNPLNYLPGCLC